MYLYEGGNVFDNTSDVAKENVAAVVDTIRRELPSGLQKKIIADIGSAGYKVQSGDIDLFLDQAATVKNFGVADEKQAKQALAQYFQAKGSAAQVMVGSNVGGITTVSGSTNTGDSANSILVPSSLSTATLPFRVVDIVRDTAVNLGTGVYSSISTATVTLASSTASALVVGTDVGSLDSSGQIIQSGSYVATAAAANATTVVLNAAPTTAFAASSTLVFTQYPEVLVKFNFGYHGYYSATAV